MDSKDNNPLTFKHTPIIFWSAQDLDPYGYPIQPKAAIPFGQRIIKIKLNLPCNAEAQQNKTTAILEE